MASKDIYFVPESSKWPIVGSLALFTLFVGSAMLLNQSPNAKYVFIVGIAAVIYMFAGWFSNVIAESLAGKYNKQVDISFRMGMGWFILSEVMFFAAFFWRSILRSRFICALAWWRRSWSSNAPVFMASI